MEKTDYHNFTYSSMSIKARRKFDVGDIYENTIECKKCGWIIRSRNRHDFVTCKCESISVDGGSWYSRQIGNQEDIISHVKMFKYVPRK